MTWFGNGNLHHGIDASTIPFPHGSKSRLATKVPAGGGYFGGNKIIHGAKKKEQSAALPFQGDVALCHTLHVEADGRDRAVGIIHQQSPLLVGWPMVWQTHSIVNSPP